STNIRRKAAFLAKESRRALKCAHPPRSVARNGRLAENEANRTLGDGHEHTWLLRCGKTANAANESANCYDVSPFDRPRPCLAAGLFSIAPIQELACVARSG